MTSEKHGRESVKPAITPEMIEAEITPEMIEEGLSALYKFPITDPDDEGMREAVRSVFISMMLARP